MDQPPNRPAHTPPRPRFDPTSPTGLGMLLIGPGLVLIAKCCDAIGAPDQAPAEQQQPTSTLTDEGREAAERELLLRVGRFILYDE